MHRYFISEIGSGCCTIMIELIIFDFNQCKAILRVVIVAIITIFIQFTQLFLILFISSFLCQYAVPQEQRHILFQSLYYFIMMGISKHFMKVRRGTRGGSFHPNHKLCAANANQLQYRKISSHIYKEICVVYTIHQRSPSVLN